MSNRPPRCPFCSNTDLAPKGKINWSCVGSLGCGAFWDPNVILAPPIRADRGEGLEIERPKPRRNPLLRASKRPLRRPPARGIFSAA